MVVGDQPVATPGDRRLQSAPAILMIQHGSRHVLRHHADHRMTFVATSPARGTGRATLGLKDPMSPFRREKLRTSLDEKLDLDVVPFGSIVPPGDTDAQLV